MVSLSFPPTNDFDSINYTAPIIGDNIHEETEGFFVQIEFSFTDSSDNSSFIRVRNGFAFIRIVNDDCEF